MNWLKMSLGCEIRCPCEKYKAYIGDVSLKVLSGGIGADENLPLDCRSGIRILRPGWNSWLDCWRHRGALLIG